jgi:hypothetical protein
MDKKPTKQEREAAQDQVVADMLFYEMDNIAVSLGIPPHEEREWTEEEAARVCCG